MQDAISEYLKAVNLFYQSGQATEHTYRPALQRLLETMLDGMRAINEPKRIECGAPDYVIAKKDIPICYIEAKDIGRDLGHKDYKAQFDRYKQSLDNIIFTDYLDFHRYRKGEFAGSVRIAEIKGGKVAPIKPNFERFEQLIKGFGNSKPQGLSLPAEIAGMMAAKAKMMAEVIEKSIEACDNPGSNALLDQMNVFKEVLIHDITIKSFADIYAQTIAYGLFAARLHDSEPGTFNRQKAAVLIPKTNPFLRRLFQDIAGYDLDARIAWIVDDLAEAFRAADMAGLGKDFGERHDPIIHFYEDFLSAYDPALRKSRGVWYTPAAVVNFIVRAVDCVLQDEFHLPKGLADKAQILDPATGTGTFLAETIAQVHKKFAGQGGMWQNYVSTNLIPRLNGFEVLMASYTMAHIKLELLLRQTGYEATDDQRLRIYLTNSLEEQHPDTKSIFAQFLTLEANEANGVKRDKPIMVVMGNPPYSVSSQNKGLWIQNLIADYKKNLNEQKLNLDDDYIKFIRFGQYYVEKNGEGILAYISNNSFIDGVTHRQMRKTLLDVFDKIYILDLHGNSKKKEVCPDGSKDENVFDIMQGVSINIFIKTNKIKDSLAEVFHFELYGKRQEKYDFLSDNNLQSIKWQLLTFNADDENYFFVPKNFEYKDEYEKGFRVDELFPICNSGVQTDRDPLFIDDDRKTLASRIKILLSGKFDSDFQKKFRVEDSSGYKLTAAIKDKSFDDSFIRQIAYRPFDEKWIYYSPELISRPASKVMKHFLNGENIGLIFKRGFTGNAPPIFISNNIVDRRSWSCPGMQGSEDFFPLFLYNSHLGVVKKEPNLDKKIFEKICVAVGRGVEPLDVLDYIYGVLHAPAYREKYKEFLKIDFPRVPYPKNAEQFMKIAKQGGELRRLHLMEGVEPQKGIADYPIEGSNKVEKILYANGKVFINSKQYFENIPQTAWEFYIGGYQPAQKWLKDRKDRVLNYNDLEHYQKIARVLMETARIMGEIDKIWLK